MLLNVPICENEDMEINCHVCRAHKPAYCFTLMGNGTVTTAGLCMTCVHSLCVTTAHGWITDLAGRSSSEDL